MATTNISITQTAYTRLANLREGKESFSDIINRITAQRDIMQFAGILSKKSADHLEKNIKQQRARLNKDMERHRKKTQKELFS